ncbi:sialate O-acetylesterase [Enterococcus sp. LJL128]
MLKLNPLISDQVVLQAEESCMISGTTEPKTTIQVVFGAKEIVTQSNANGQFIFELPPQEYGKKTQLSITTELDFIEIAVQFGDVFLFAGQSNMEYKMKDELHFETEQANELNKIFFNNVPDVEFEEKGKDQPSDLQEYKWQQLDKKTITEFSAIAYYASKKYRENNPDVLIGIVCCSKGGTSASCWVGEECLLQDNELNEAILTPYKQAIKGKGKVQFEQQFQDFLEQSKAYYVKREKMIQENPNWSLGEVKKVIGYSPWPPPASPYLFTRPSGLYQTMFQKIVPFTFKAVIWYQGEEDTVHSFLYEKLLKLLIVQWREELGTIVPFYIIQLPLCQDRKGHDWATVREAQQKISMLIEKTFLVTGLDCGEPDNIHPPEKSILGSRVGEIIGHQYYPSAPIAKLEKWTTEEVVIVIDQAKKLSHTGIQIFQPNEAIQSIEYTKNEIRIKLKNEIMELGYAWKNVPDAILYNEVGYPVSPFKFKKYEIGVD